MSFLLVSIIAFVSMFVPGALLALALLKGTKLHLFETLSIGFIFGLIAPATLTWLEAYLMNYIHFFAFSLGLFEANAAFISIIAAIVCYKEGVFRELASGLNRTGQIREAEREIKAEEKEYSIEIASLRAQLLKFEKAKELVKRHESEEADLGRRHTEEMRLVDSFNQDEIQKVKQLHKKDEDELAQRHIREERMLLVDLEREGIPKPATSGKVPFWVWMLLLTLMLLTFATRVVNLGISDHFFQFDSYFDMLSTQRIIALGYQPLYSTSAWPVLANGSITRLQPIVPYLEAYWYSLANQLGPHSQAFNTNLMSFVSGVYPPLTAALLVFVIFLLLYREYDEYVGLIGAAFATVMPILFSTFVAGQQLLQPWGIFTLFFFFAAYMLAVKDMKSKRLAVLAGVAFASTFLGAHYYTVDAGILALYIIFQGIVSTLRGDMSRDFYKMNAIVLIVISVFFVLYQPYQATLSERIPSILGIPIIISGPLLGLLLVAIVDQLPKQLHQRHILFKRLGLAENLLWVIFIAVLGIAAVIFTPLGAPIHSYVALSTKFTTPSTPLFMTVQEYEPTGPLYNFGSAGLGLIGASALGFPLMVYLVMGLTMVLIVMSIYYRRSTTGMLYLMIAFPLAFAAFSEVAYIPHFGAAYVMIVGIIIGEFGVMAGNGFKLSFTAEAQNVTETLRKAYVNHKEFMYFLFAVALFFLSPIVSLVFILVAIFYGRPENRNYLWALFIILALVEAGMTLYGLPVFGEANSVMGAISGAAQYASNPSTACSAMQSQGNSMGLNLFCNQIPQYWLNAMAFINTTVGPSGPRVLSWWDYGDWINWFGQSPAVIRGDNAVNKEDFATAANYVLGKRYNYSTQTLATLMDTNQTGYVLFDQDLIGKWGALDFLACVNINQTSRAYAIAQGKVQNPPTSFVLGTSQCELRNDPQYALIPLPTLAPTIEKPALSDYCTLSNSNESYALSYLLVGSQFNNQSVCISTNPGTNGALQLYYSNGTKMNAVIQVVSQSPLGALKLTQNGPTYLQYMVIYLPNGPNGTITDAPTDFYQSNYYKGFILGNLPGFTEVYPGNISGKINFVNGTYPVRIFKLNNFTGTLPTKTLKPSFVHNNYTLP